MFFGRDNARECKQASDCVQGKRTIPAYLAGMDYRGNGDDGGRIARWNIDRLGDNL
jgi:hypothetical protein